MAMKQKRRDPIKWIIVATVLLVLVVVGTMIANSAISSHYEKAFQAEKHEAINGNTQAMEDWEQQLAQHNAEKAALQAQQPRPVPNPEGWSIVDVSGFPVKNPGTVTATRGEVMHNGLLLVNASHSRPDDFDESGILSISSYAREAADEAELGSFWRNSSCKLQPVAIDALLAALKDAKAVGLEHFVVNDSYRTYDRQNELFQAQVEEYREDYPNYSEEKLIERAKRKVNYPGTSEFNTGLAFTLYLYESGNEELKDTPFYQTEQGKWFYENCWKYGFIFRFPTYDWPYPYTEDKAFMTGVSITLNCYRYVGEGHALAMKQLGMCLEEYVQYLQEHPHIEIYENNVLRYVITTQHVGDDAASFQVTIDRSAQSYTMSLDNMGNVVTVHTYPAW